MKKILSVINENWIEEEAGYRFYERGLNYFLSGAVESTDITEDKISAVVSGSYDYHVSLHLVDGYDIDYDCSCPVGESGSFCKHLVAVALKALNCKETVCPEIDNSLQDFLMRKGKAELNLLR